MQAVYDIFSNSTLTNLQSFVILNELCEQRKCGSVGTGRRARLRILWQQCRVGSSPIFRIFLLSFFLSDTPLWFHRSYNTYVTPYSCAIVSFGPVSRSICSSHFFSCSSRFCLRSASFRDRTVSFSCFLRSSTTRKSESCSHSNILCH